MGANQSSNAGGSNTPGGGGRRATGEVKTCYYELLGIDRQASEDEIKKAYRKKALELHPDRNYGNVEATTKRFADVQSAYEVLSDPQERAWYDSHRDAILSNEDVVSGEHFEHNVRITTSDDIMRMFTNFRGKVDLTDSDTGFYTVLRRTFDTLAREEELACEWEGLDSIPYPSFGHADDAYDDVVRPFYAAWNGFATRKSFSWEDVYRYSEAPDRRVRRMMEKENKRFREEGIREFNDAVRSLIAFVKKRDPRFKLNTKNEAERQKLLRDTAIAQAARSRAANQAKQGQQESMPGWMKSSEVREPEIFDESEGAAQEQFECVVCKKSFKSENQYEAHERSRKHVRAVQHLKRQMQQEDSDLHLEELDETNAEQPDASNVVNSEDADSVPNLEAAFKQGGDISLSYDEPDQQPEVGSLNGSKEGPRKSSDDISGPIAANDSPESSSDNEHTTCGTLQERILNRLEETIHEDIDQLSETLASKSLNQDNDLSALPRMGKAKEKRAKKAAQKSTANAESEADFKCAACQAVFPSKTKLFNHIKDLGHAQLVSKPAKGGKGKKR
ncbi:MAG: hypothetical protein ALECFALPRED_010930 [Alectoria fallacina]|uniref:Uncharacterized protein n=1 Tax=Alectoria fallacina TaxID=1903189 RepID=A0A8H3PJX1_9LECA|nr:MAG: hypothetical protein ALECFALPRED_010930 [Alectoria fallacina]